MAAGSGPSSLARLRRRAGLSQEELAERSGLSVRAISNLERGTVDRPRRRSLNVLADALGLTESAKQSFIDHYRYRGHAGDPDDAGLGPMPPIAELPVLSTDFVGRTSDLRWLDAALTERGGIVVVDGPPGIGKTTLTLRWAHKNRLRFAHGQLYANLRGFGPLPPTMPEEVLGQFLRTLGIAAHKIPADCDGRSAMFRSCVADCRMLIVLDNARSAEQVRPLLAAGAGVVVVVTSRNRLAGLSIREGARHLTLGALSKMESSALLAKYVDTESFRDPAKVQEVLGYCGGSPLAIQIMGEWLSARGVSSSDLSRLHVRRYRQDVLDSIRGDESTRVSTVFSWSYDALDRPARRAFVRLALHPGRDLGLGVAAALCGLSSDEVREQIDVLRQAHLIEAPRCDRWEYHDLLRDYARGLSERHMSVAARRAAFGRMFAYYLGHVHAATESLALVGEPGRSGHRHVKLFAGQEDATAWLRAELPNLVDVAEGAEAVGFAEQAVLLSQYLWRYLLIHADLDVARRVHTAAQRAAEALDDKVGEARALGELGAVYMQQGRYQDALAYQQRSVAVGESAGERMVVDRAVSNLGIVHARLGDHKAAISYIEQSLRLARELGDPVRESVALNNLGSVHERSGDYGAALLAYRDAVDIARTANDAACTAAALHSLGSVQRRLGHCADARATLNEAIAVARQGARLEAEGNILADLGLLDVTAGDVAEAERRFEQAEQIATVTGLRALQLKAKVGFAEAHLARGNVAGAVQLYQQACEVARDMHDPYQEAGTLQGLGSALWAAGQREAARTVWRTALAGYRSLGTVGEGSLSGSDRHPDGRHAAPSQAAESATSRRDNDGVTGQSSLAAGTARGV